MAMGPFADDPVSHLEVAFIRSFQVNFQPVFDLTGSQLRARRGHLEGQ